ncbi:MAG: citrate lyase acyl carrier protein [Bacteroidota bacterium]|nr:citrate lyase acyl carrier protein [Bacteroidota bacterium]
MVKEKFSQTGNYGGKIRSDCQVILETAMSGGIQIELVSKVKAMYGQAIESLIRDMFQFYGIEHIHVSVQDTGAVPFVMAARIEAAIKKMLDTDLEFLQDPIEGYDKESSKDHFRFSRLYLPGNSPSLMLNAGVHKPNGLILDLEDAVAVEKKYEARFLVRNALRKLNFYGAEKMVRINQIPAGLVDLDYIVNHGVQLILVPKCESADQIHEVNNRIEQIQSKAGSNRNIWLMPIIESALGVIKAFDIASSAENIVALAIGLEDYTADLGCKRTFDGTESFYARSAVVNACKAVGIQAIDSVFSDVGDIEGLKLNVRKSKSLGFDGMGCIHPRQIRVIHENFAPEPDEITRAQKIVMAFEEATRKGLGVVSLGTKMIDPPVVKRAEKIVKLATDLEMIPKNWRDKYGD